MVTLVTKGEYVMKVNNSYRRVAEKIRDSGVILQAGVWLLILAVVAVVISIRDYYTSMLGIATMPINSVDPQTADRIGKILAQTSIYAVAFLPQGVAWLGTFIYMIMDPESEEEDRFRKAALMVAILAHAADVYTGYIYYIDEVGKGIIPFSPAYFRGIQDAIGTVIVSAGDIRAAVNAALFHSLLIDTMGSEILSSVVFGMLAVLWPDIKRQWKTLRGKTEGNATKPVDIPTHQPVRAPINNMRPSPVRQRPSTPVTRQPPQQGQRPFNGELDYEPIRYPGNGEDLFN